MPPELRELLGPPPESSEIVDPARDPVPRPLDPECARELQRHAFDKDRLGRIRRRTGVCFLDTSQMALPSEDEFESA